jgi:two-component system sensor histidine kinase UhpB
VELTVADDGSGFTFDQAARGLGIAGMRERALLVGGDMQVESRLDSGTRVRLTVPLEPADRSREWKRNGHMPSQSSKETPPQR